MTSLFGLNNKEKLIVSDLVIELLIEISIRTKFQIIIKNKLLSYIYSHVRDYKIILLQSFLF